jgi:glutamate synthase (NADPH/NADH) small chain
MPTLDLEKRKTTFAEIKLGFTPEMAVAEAKRCIQCKMPQCKLKGCPLHNRIPEWIALIRDNKFMEAAALTRETSSMPEVCGRVCPQERLCEGSCALGIKHEAVAIGALERFANDYAATQGDIPLKTGAPTGKKVAVVGAGPAGMACAEQLRQAGHEVVLYDALEKAGGMLRYALPKFKIAEDVVDRRWKLLAGAGVKFVNSSRLGEKLTLDSLLNGQFDAVFVGIGTWTPSIPKVPGMEAKNVTEALAFLKGTADGYPVKGKKAVVLGGGDTAMDSARYAIRRGASSSIIAYRRDEANMPGSKKEVKAAKEEGVDFQCLISPLEIQPGPDGAVKAIKFQRMELGEPDKEGRRSPKPIPGTEFVLNADVVVFAFGYKLDPKWAAENLKLEINKDGNILVNPETGATTRPGVFSGGDCVLGADLVVRAVMLGRKAASGINKYLLDKNWTAVAPGAPAS